MKSKLNLKVANESESETYNLQQESGQISSQENRLKRVETKEIPRTESRDVMTCNQSEMEELSTCLWCRKRKQDTKDDRK